MPTHSLIFLTDRGIKHQEAARHAAPANVSVTMLRTPTFDELLPYLPTADFIISERNQPVTAAMIEAAPRLKRIVRLGSLGYDIDSEAAAARGIKVVVQPVLGSLYCAEHALMMSLAVIKKLGRGLHDALNAAHGLPAQRGDENTFAFNWLGYTDVGGLIGKTIAIVGMGEIGVEYARLVRPFRPAAVYYHKRTPYPASVEAALGIQYAELTACLTAADVLVSLLPYAEDTDYRHGGLNAARLALLKPGAVLVHLGSGSVVDEAAVLEMLRMGRLSGAAFDTYEYEPLQPDNPLVLHARDPRSNLLLTPHTAAAYVGGGREGDYAAILDALA